LYTDNPTIVLKATQGGSLGESSFTYNWLANCSAPQPNTPPRVNIPLTGQTAQAGQGFGYTIPQTTFTDNESPHTLVLSVGGLPTGMSFSPPTQIGGIPTVSGVYTVTVTATDPGGLSVPATFQLTVLPAGQASGFAITGVQTLSCASASGGRRSVTFTPQYSGLDGSPVSFSIVNELLPTTNSGPYTLALYPDNPRLQLQAQQGGATASYTYDWLAACSAPARHGLVELGSGLQVKVLGNPLVGSSVALEISGIIGQWVVVNLVDLQGHKLGGARIERSEEREQLRLRVDRSAGVLLLEVHTVTERQVIRLLQK
ncbi:putative Ig domain-containing protein, partial [Spirosoma daeguense]